MSNFDSAMIVFNILVFIIALLTYFYVYIWIQNIFMTREADYLVGQRLAKIQVVSTTSSEPDNFFSRFIEKYNVLDKIKNVSKVNMQKTREWLILAGYRASYNVLYYLIAKSAAAVVGVILGIIGMYFFPIVKPGFNVTLLYPIAGALALFFMVDAQINSLIKDRQKKITLGISDMLDLMVICTEPGAGTEETVKRVAIELQTSHPLLAEEMKQTVVELGLSSDHDKPFFNLIKRIQIPQVSVIFNAIIQSAEFGTAIASTLRSLSDEYRKEKMLAAEAKASRLPALMTLPLMIFILPTLFIVVIGPVALKAIAISK